MTTSYARYVAQNYPSETNPNAKIVGVKVYRVIHRILLPPDIVDGRRPLDEDTYEAFYLGEFDDKGELLDPNDPFLYWAIPNIKMAAGTGNLTEKKEPTYLEYHAKRIKTNRQ